MSLKMHAVKGWSWPPQSRSHNSAKGMGKLMLCRLGNYLEQPWEVIFFLYSANQTGILSRSSIEFTTSHTPSNPPPLGIRLYYAAALKCRVSSIVF